MNWWQKSWSPALKSYIGERRNSKKQWSVTVCEQWITGSVWMACETECNALKSEETEYLTDKKYPVSKLRVVD